MRMILLLKKACAKARPHPDGTRPYFLVRERSLSGITEKRGEAATSYLCVARPSCMNKGIEYRPKPVGIIGAPYEMAAKRFEQLVHFFRGPDRTHLHADLALVAGVIIDDYLVVNHADGNCRAQVNASTTGRAYVSVDLDHLGTLSLKHDLPVLAGKSLRFENDHEYYTRLNPPTRQPETNSTNPS
jgi:hypothetical protein